MRPIVYDHMPEFGTQAREAFFELKREDPDTYFEGLKTALRHPEDLGEHPLFHHASFAAGAVEGHLFRARQREIEDQSTVTLHPIKFVKGVVSKMAEISRSVRGRSNE